MVFGRKRKPGPVLRHEQPARDVEPLAVDHSATVDVVGRHLAHFVGPVSGVFSEIVSQRVQIDVHVVPAHASLPCHALVTAGMSDRPMRIPTELQGQVSRFAELMILLPPEWPVDPGSWRNERHYWPIRQLKILARSPHEYGSWLGAWHSVPNGDPPRPFAVDTQFCGAMLAPVVNFPDEFRTVRADDGREIMIYAVLPLLRDELEAKVKYGVEVLLPRFEAHGITELFDPQRESALRR